MHAGEVVPHVEQRNHVHVILDLLRERVGQAREAPHLTLDKTGRDDLSHRLVYVNASDPDASLDRARAACAQGQEPAP